MATDLMRDVRRTSDEARDVISKQTEHLKSRVSPAGVALTLVGIAVAAGVVASTIYFTPDAIRYLKIRRM